MSDVTIPADDAKRLAGHLRGVTTMGYYPWIDELADLLDPPATSLLDEVRDTISDLFDRDIIPIDCADAILAVVRRHVAALATNWPEPVCECWMAYRDDVLRLLGASDE